MADTPNTVNPLNWQVPIVNKDGTPTNEFQRKWQQQAAVNGSIPALSTAAEVSAVLDILAATPDDILVRGATLWGGVDPSTLFDTAGAAAAAQAAAEAFAANASNLSSGTVAAARLPIATTAALGGVIPDGSTITVNGSGVITASGGGGSGGPPAFLHLPAGTGSAANATASIGMVVSPSQNITVSAVACILTTVTGATYRIGIAPWNQTTLKITAAPTYSSSLTVGAGAANTLISTPLAISLTAGSSYLIFITRTDATATTSLTLNDNNQTYATPAIVWTANTVLSAKLASLAPLTTDTWANAGSVNWCLGLLYTSSAVVPPALTNGHIIVGGAGNLPSDVAMSGHATITNTGVVTVGTSGTWTPSLSFSGAATGITYSVQVGTWVKVGSLLYVNAYIILSSKGTSTGPANLGGLPFASALPAAAYSSGAVSCGSMGASVNLPMGFINGTSSSVILQNLTAGVGRSLTDADFTNTSAFAFSACYPVVP